MMRSRTRRRRLISTVAAVGGAGALLAAMGAGALEQPSEQVQRMIQKLQGLTRAQGYLTAHKDEQNPFTLLGGPVDIQVDQHEGGVFVALPARRELDPDVFGTPETPLAIAGTPGITGVPPAFRNAEGGRYTNLKKLTPFGDEFKIMGEADLTIRAHDETATDAAYTQDSVDFEASWQDREGNTYSVKCDTVLPHGLEYPTFGGVVTNHLMHGWTRIGTPLMPTEMAYMAFWGMGTVHKNGEKIDGPRVVHGMLTEYVRADGYRLGFDKDVTPSRRHFHLMVAPFKPNKEAGHFEHHNVKTGFTLPNGKELPFWHVMFENLDVSASRS